MNVSIGIVLYNSMRFLPKCLNSVFIQARGNFEVIAVDNHSTDGSPDFVVKNYPQVKIIRNGTNKGFSYAHNQAISASTGKFYLCLNPDVILKEHFLEEILKSIDINTTIGTATGKIYRLDEDFAIKPAIKILDSTGIYLTKNMRHFDRGSGEIDREQYDKKEFIFGATGACCLFRRKMLEDIRINGEFFDNDFFFSREDIDLAWRSQIAGWKTIYTPSAISYHLRTVLPERRSSLPAKINMHSVKNRYLLQIKNHTIKTYLATFPHAFARECIVIAGVLIKEQYSLKGVFFVLKNWKRIIAKRKQVMRKRKVSNIYLANWFREKVYVNRSKLADKYLKHLKGIEIGGSFHNRFGLNTLNVDYTDDINTIFKQEERNFCGEALKVDIVAKGDALPFKDNEWDFVISSHVLEHFFDPIKAIKEWLRVIKPGGYIFIIVPHKERTFDKNKERTTLKELIDRNSEKIPTPEFDIHKHYSVWITEDLLELCNYLKLKVVACHNIDDKIGNGFTIVIRKRKNLFSRYTC